MESDDVILKTSFDFISQNFHITFEKVPKELREMWYCDSDSDEAQIDFSWTVFMYAIVYGKKLEGLQSFTIDEDRLSALFKNWQFCLAMAVINDVTDIRINPLPIFEIENLEKLMIKIKFDN